MERVVLATRPQEAVDRAIAVLQAGGIALLPAEGVYGFHAIASDAHAVEKLRALKPRGAEKRFIGLIADSRELVRWAEPSARASELARAHWPGALTLVLKAAPALPESLRGPDGTVALRCPGNDFLRAVVSGSGGIVISTSANDPGEPPLVRAEGPLLAQVDLVVDQGELSGTPSTVIAVDSDQVRVLREGAVRIGGK